VINADGLLWAESYRVRAEQLKSGSKDATRWWDLCCAITLSESERWRGACAKVSKEGYLESIAELTAIGRDGDKAKEHRRDGKVTVLNGMTGVN